MLAEKLKSLMVIWVHQTGAQCTVVAHQGLVKSHPHFFEAFKAMAQTRFQLPPTHFKYMLRALLPALVATLCGCATGSAPSDPSVASESALSNRRCTASENLLVDTEFTREGDYTRAWRMAQHTGELSFSTEASEGVLEMRRIAMEPWMLMRQTVKDSRLSGATILFTAELKGDLPSEPKLHGFDHIGGLYLKVGRGKAQLAEHEPNAEQWDWQTFSYEEEIPEGITSLRAGFVHQSGGALWARDPSLVILDCK